MKLWWLLGLVCAVVLHAAVLLFGGALFPRDLARKSFQEVELLGGAVEDEAREEDPEPEQGAERDEQEIETPAEEVPDAAAIVRELDASALHDAPMLEAASLGAIEAALGGQGGTGGFSDSLSSSSGGRIGGTGRADVLGGKLEEAFSLAEIDQKPRPLFQSAPVYPGEMRGKKLEGIVTVIFVVDASGKVSTPRVETSSHPAFERPALDAIKQWKFEPAVKGGQRVGCKMRVPIRFPAS
jgi:TonB family protein